MASDPGFPAVISGIGLFGPSLTTGAMAGAVSDQAWLAAMLRFESELALAQAELGLIPPEAAGAIALACAQAGFDVDELGRAAMRSANPVVPLVKALIQAVGPAAGSHAHFGTTSQDALDTATMLVAREALEVLGDELDGLAAACAELADRHRGTLMAGRTLMQQAVPVTFGLKASGWLTALVDCRRSLTQYRQHRLAVQFGGAAGNLSALGERGLEVTAALALRLGLAEPVTTWHSDRTRIVELAGLLAAIGGAAGKVALDVILLAQTEVAELAERAPGGSSAMPHKQNPVAAIEADTCVRLLLGQVQVLMGSQRTEQERAAGAWQAESPAITNAFLLAAGVVARTRQSLEGLRVDGERMRRNLDSTGGLLMAESLTAVLAAKLGRARAREVVESCAARACESGTAFRLEAMADPLIAGPLNSEAVAGALDPTRYLGATGALIDRALAHHRKEIS